jgi:hypothetical protein
MKSSSLFKAFNQLFWNQILYLAKFTILYFVHIFSEPVCRILLAIDICIYEL